jgi:hypothetical protein
MPACRLLLCILLFSLLFGPSLAGLSAEPASDSLDRDYAVELPRC